MNIAERKLKEKTAALLEATEALSCVLEHLIHRLDDFIGGPGLTSKALKYFNDHKYRLVLLLQYLKTRNYVDFLSVLPIYQKTPLPTALLSTLDLAIDVSIMNQLQRLMQQKVNESYQCVLLLKTQSLVHKYRNMTEKMQGDNLI
jgi:hypothetical protein